MARAGTLDEAVRAIVETIVENGLCVVPGAIGRDEAMSLRALLDRLREREAPSGDDSLNHRRVLALATKHPAFVELMCHPLVGAVSERLLGPDFICSTWTANTLLPGFAGVYWHVDHPYWTIAPPYPIEPPLTAHAIWCLDDFSPASGSTLFIPGSHRRASLPEHGQDCEFEAIAIDAPAGSVILAHGAIWHSPGRNNSTHPRSAIFGRYARSYLIPQEDMRHQLAQLRAPSELVRRLMGERQYVPQRGLPY